MKTGERTSNEGLVTVPDDARGRMLQAAERLSWLVLALMLASAVVTSTVDGLLGKESAWAREAFRGGELVSLLVACPLLATALMAARRGSVRGRLVWIGLLLYAVYNYAYAVFGTTFNDAFLVHIGAFSASVFALACALPALDYAEIAGAFHGARTMKGVGIFLVVVGVGQGLLWLFVIARNAVTGEVLHDIPVNGQHLVFALDLALLVPSLILSGVLLARRRPFGVVFGTAVTVMGAAYQLNLMMAGVYGAAADVPGAEALPMESLILTASFIVAAVLLLFVSIGAPARSGLSGTWRPRFSRRKGGNDGTGARDL
jgi:hypothetical protein